MRSGLTVAEEIEEAVADLGFGQPCDLAPGRWAMSASVAWKGLIGSARLAGRCWRVHLRGAQHSWNDARARWEPLHVNVVALVDCDHPRCSKSLRDLAQLLSETREVVVAGQPYQVLACRLTPNKLIAYAASPVGGNHQLAEALAHLALSD